MKRLILTLLVIISTVIIWLPFWGKINLPFWNIDFQKGSFVLWQNFDGPNYLIVEKTWYNKTDILNKFSGTVPAEYYPAHFPLYPALVSLLDLVMVGPWAMLFTTLIGSVLCYLMFYQFLREFKITKAPFLLSLIFLIFPFRWLAVRSIGSPEPWFIFFILASVYNYRKERYWYTAFFGFLSLLTKSPAILLLAAYGIDFLIQSIKDKKIQWEKWPAFLMGLAIPVLFAFYQSRTGDFWAYFHSGDNIHLFWPPFSIFSPKGQAWVGNFWLEDVLWIWLFFGWGVLKLKNKRLQIESIFAGLFFLSTLFVSHRDIARYILPISPFVLMGWSKALNRKEVKVILAILVIPVFLYSWTFLMNNTAPVADWAPYL